MHTHAYTKPSNAEQHANETFVYFGTLTSELPRSTLNYMFAATTVCSRYTFPLLPSVFLSADVYEGCSKNKVSLWFSQKIPIY